MIFSKFFVVNVGVGVCFPSSLLLLLGSVFVFQVPCCCCCCGCFFSRFISLLLLWWVFFFPSSFIVVAVAGDLFIFSAPFVTKRKNHVGK